MPDSESPSDGQPVTLQQKLTLIAAHERTGNMALAIREADRGRHRQFPDGVFMVVSVLGVGDSRS